MQDYRRLRVWRNAHALVLNVRRATHRFPRTGYASLKSQVTRAAESVPFNIVEGCGSHSQKDFARFLEVSIKSTSELEYQLLLAKDYGVLAPDKWKTLTEETIETRRMLCGLRARVIESDRSQSTNHGKTDDGPTANL
jgi:four helix bundle protein